MRDQSENQRGVRGLTYSYDFGGNLASFGFENYINLWNPEVIIFINKIFLQ
jgi:hypothetical protein